MMRSFFVKWLPLAVLLLVLAAFGYLAVVDLPVARAPVEKTIPNDRFAR